MCVRERENEQAKVLDFFSNLTCHKANILKITGHGHLVIAYSPRLIECPSLLPPLLFFLPSWTEEPAKASTCARDRRALHTTVCSECAH